MIVSLSPLSPPPHFPPSQKLCGWSWNDIATGSESWGRGLGAVPTPDFEILLHQGPLSHSPSSQIPAGRKVEGQWAFKSFKSLLLQLIVICPHFSCLRSRSGGRGGFLCSLTQGLSILLLGVGYRCRNTWQQWNMVSTPPLPTLPEGSQQNSSRRSSPTPPPNGHLTPMTILKAFVRICLLKQNKTKQKTWQPPHQHFYKELLTKRKIVAAVVGEQNQKVKG